MFVRSLILALLYLGTVMAASSAMAASPPRMRPYTGIGVVVFPGIDATQKQNLQLQLYEEPGIVRLNVLNSSALTGNEWIFDPSEGAAPLIVSARKGEWFRVFFDDAGREAWINPHNIGQFQSWEQYLKLRTGRMLPALQPKYYHLLQQPGGKQLVTLTPKLLFRVVRLEKTWAMVLTDTGQIGWVRWLDDDGRLTVGTGKFK
jgi:hypothetical protein